MVSTILDQANISAGVDDVRSGLIESFASGSALLRAMPVVTIQGNSYSYRREVSIPTSGWRSVNEPLSESTGRVEKRTENLKILGLDLDVDNFIVETGGAEQRTVQEMLAAKSMGQKVGLSLIKGAIVTAQGATGDAESFDGLQARYGGGFGSTAVVTTGENSGQLLANNGASDALSIAKLDEGIMKVEGATHLVMPKKMRINMKTLLRNSASMSMSEDQFGNPVEMYGKLAILDADELGNEAGIAFDENNDTTCSIYVARLAEDGLHLIQSSSGIRVKDLGEQDSKPVWRTRLEWYLGMVDAHKRCVCRIYNIADLAAVA